MNENLSLTVADHSRRSSQRLGESCFGVLFLSDRSLARINRAVASGRIVPYFALFILAVTVAAALVVWIFAQGEFDSFGTSLWWAAQTVTTVGYGDVTPITPLGRVIGGFVTLLGIGVIALPTGIIAGAFIEEHKRRDFVVNWSLIAAVPFFRTLAVAEIIDLAGHIEPIYARPGDEIVRRGEEGDALFIISSGEVEVDLGPEDLAQTAHVAPTAELVLVAVEEAAPDLDAASRLDELVAEGPAATTFAGPDRGSLHRGHARSLRPAGSQAAIAAGPRS